jgi:hypothetical protein
MFHVQWRQSAVNELTAIWTRADSGLRRAITLATQRVDEVLRTDPVGHSESRLEGRRILFASPLGVTFRIETDRNRLRVLHVWIFGKRRA